MAADTLGSSSTVRMAGLLTDRPPGSVRRQRWALTRRREGAPRIRPGPDSLRLVVRGEIGEVGAIVRGHTAVRVDAAQLAGELRSDHQQRRQRPAIATQCVLREAERTAEVAVASENRGVGDLRLG